MTHTIESLIALAALYPSKPVDPNASETRKTIEAALEVCFSPGAEYTHAEIVERLEAFVVAVDGEPE